jgi:hypothetical protein
LVDEVRGSGCIVAYFFLLGMGTPRGR